MLLAYLSRFQQAAIKGKNMDIHCTEKEAGEGLDGVRKAPLKQLEDSQKEPASNAGLLGVSGGTSFRLDTQPRVEGVLHWGLND